MFDLSLYVITDPYLSKGRSHMEVVEKAIAGGATMIQLREKESTSLDFYRLAKEVVSATKKQGVPLIINDRVDIALAVDAEGIHVGQKDLPAPVVRKMIGKDKILGVSAGNIEEAKIAEKEGADYIGVGAVFSTATKSDARQAIGLERLQTVAKSVNIPAVAIGGINHDNVEAVIQSGVDGVAVVSAIVAAENIQKAAEEMKIFIDRSK